VSLLNKAKTLVVCLNSTKNTVTLNISNLITLSSIEKYNPQIDFRIMHKEEELQYCSDYVLLTKQKEIIPGIGIKTSYYLIYNNYMLINATGNMIRIFQENTQSFPMGIKPGVPFPFTWIANDSPVRIFICFDDASITESFSLHELGSIVQQLILPNKNPGNIVRIERYIDKGVRYIKIANESKEYPCYVLHNESLYVTIGYKEKAYNTKNYQYLPPSSKVALGWVFPQKEHIMSLKFMWGNANERPIQLSETSLDFSMDKIERYAPITLSIRPGYNKYLWVTLESDEDSKILRVRDMVKRYNPAEEQVNQSVILLIQSIGVSLVSSYLNKRCEVLYMNLQEITFAINKGEVAKEIEIIVKDIQIDNQMKRESSFPILLARKRDKKSNKMFLNARIMSDLLVDPKVNFYSFESIRISIIPFVVKIEQDCLTAIIDFFNKVKGEQEEEGDTLNDSDANKSETGISVKDLMISDIKFNVSFKSSMDANTSSNVIVKSLVAAFVNLKELPITLKKITFTDVYGKLNTILLMLLQNYQKVLLSMKLGFVTGVLFTPFMDVNHFGMGITNFINDSTEGAAGIVSGTGSLVKGAVAGTFGTVSGVTSAVSQGILALSADEEYIKERQKDNERYKPENIFEGIGLGLVSTFMSVGSGIAGVITKPIEGASKEGVKGLFKVILNKLVGSWSRISRSGNETNKRRARSSIKNNRRN